MGMLTRLFYPWGLLLQIAAIVHFIRRRPDTYWLYIILFLGPVGALVYIFAEVVPDFGLLNQSFKGMSRWPCSRPSRFQSVSPCLTKTRSGSVVGNDGEGRRPDRDEDSLDKRAQSLTVAMSGASTAFMPTT